MRDDNKQLSRLRALPSVDALIRTDIAVARQTAIGADRLKALARLVTDELRREIAANEDAVVSREQLLREAARRLDQACEQDSTKGIRHVINATGVILHTNLGRAPLSQAAREAIVGAGAGYCTLEYDQLTGARGRRGARVEELLIQVTGAEDALVVNNCAAAALLILMVLAGDGETVVSRSELVEIGGDFRVPDVMSASGTTMVEVGTTNRTKLADYQSALNNRTRLIMRVHQSNYRIVGFTTSPSLAELAQLAHQSGLPLYEDAGSGALMDLSALGLSEEPVIRASINSNADVVSFSGDKLLGSSQAGLIVGRAEIIGRLRKHPLFRALRADKLTLAALEATLEAHRRGTANKEVPVLRMMSYSAEDIASRAKTLISSLNETLFQFELVPGESAIGGGSGPDAHPKTTLIAITHPQYSAEQIERALRMSDPPVICMIRDGRLIVDFRTVDPAEEPFIKRALSSLNA